MPLAPHPPTPPPVLLAQRYRLERRLAQGGMAEVWLATDTLLSRHVAVKLLKPTLASDPIVAERFRREAILVAGLNHPNIVAVYDSIAEDGRQAVVMQLVNGKSLRQLLDEQKRLSPELTMHIGACVAAALDTAHRADLVHRDVKPGNILLTSDGRVLLTDFGIAKGLAAAAGDDLTSDNIMMGTAKYLSPEQVRGKKLDGRADLYSLGLVLYECLAGRVPFLGETDADTALARLNRDPTDLARLRPTLPYGLAELIHRLLARRPDDRYRTGAQLKAEITKVASRANDPTNTFTPPRGDSTPTPTRGTPVMPQRDARPVSGYRPVPASAHPPTVSRRPDGPGTRTPATGAPASGGRSRGDGSSGGMRSGRPAGAPVRADRTPPNAARPRQQPNRANEQRQRTSVIVVGGLLLLALIVGMVLWATSNSDGPPQSTVATTVAPNGAAPISAVGQPNAVSTGIQALTLYDPDGDGTEQPGQVSLADDGDPATAWTTVCYADRFLGGKKGLGLVADLGTAASGTITADIASAPYQVIVLASAGDTIPSTVDGWIRIDNANAATPGRIRAQVGGVRFVAVLFNELGPDTGCTNNRFRGKIGEISFEAG